MRILLSFLQGKERSNVSSYRHWRFYMLSGFNESAIEAIEVPSVDWIDGVVLPPGEALQAWRTRAWEETLTVARREHAKKPIDFFLCYLYPRMVDISAIRDLQDLGIPCVNFYCDNAREFRKVPREFYEFDLNWVPEYQAISMYEDAGLPYIHSAMPCWVAPELRTYLHQEREGVTFIGSPDELRWQLLGEAIAGGVEIDIFGVGWQGKREPKERPPRSIRTFLSNQVMDIDARGIKAWLLKFERHFRPLPTPPVIPAERLRGPLSSDDLIRVAQQSTVTLGINRVLTPYCSVRKPVTYSRLRDIEVPMMGGCYLTEWAEDLEHLYTLGEEIETYRTVEELKEKVDSLLKDPKRRQSMRQMAQARALAEHSIPRTLQRIRDGLKK